MSSAVLLQHDELYPAPRLVAMLRDFGIPVEIRKLYAGDAVPSDLDEVRMLVLLGGTRRTVDVESDLNLQREVVIAKKFIDADRPILGIGFGAELLSFAGGGKVTENRKPSPPGPPGSPPPASPPPPGDLAPEFGWAQVSFPFPGGAEPIVFGMVDNAPFFTWHTDTFNPPMLPQPPNPPPPPAPRPPTGNSVLASTRACRNQAYRFKNRVFGFQFHFELEQPDINRIIDARATSAGLSGEQITAMKADTAKNYSRYDRLSSKLITNLVQFLKAY